ncbi:hypothetical protein ACRAVF_11855 [Bradyrhizobium oligotrophicum S58]
MLLKTLLDRIGDTDIQRAVTATRENIDVIHRRTVAWMDRLTQLKPVVMGPCVRRDDTGCVARAYHKTQTVLALPARAAILTCGRTAACAVDPARRPRHGAVLTP